MDLVCEIVRSEEINGAALLSLAPDDIASLGLKVGPRRLFLNAMALVVELARAQETTRADSPHLHFELVGDSDIETISTASDATAPPSLSSQFSALAVDAIVSDAAMVTETADRLTDDLASVDTAISVVADIIPAAESVPTAHSEEAVVQVAAPVSSPPCVSDASTASSAFANEVFSADDTPVMTRSTAKKRRAAKRQAKLTGGFTPSMKPVKTGSPTADDQLIAAKRPPVYQPKWSSDRSHSFSQATSAPTHHVVTLQSAPVPYVPVARPTHVTLREFQNTLLKVVQLNSCAQHEAMMIQLSSDLTGLDAHDLCTCAGSVLAIVPMPALMTLLISCVDGKPTSYISDMNNMLVCLLTVLNKLLPFASLEDIGSVSLPNELALFVNLFLSHTTARVRLLAASVLSTVAANYWRACCLLVIIKLVM
eukprot:TRINITY_DN462_c0_g1_i2.p1 TRINITY_DN462_c0_g1~~TRINITY_DN462_c0_g1_i2.p1  ORF type:complete len:463 (-),score=89.40 TRINITY_DN462_c0_g1_i2:884-2158(-)